MNGKERIEEASRKYPGAISKKTLTILTINAEKMGRFSIADETLKRIFVPELDSLLNHLRNGSATQDIAVRRTLAILSMRERPIGFQDNQEGNKALEDIARAILQYEANKIMIERKQTYEISTPVIHMDPANGVDSFIRVGWTVPPQYAPIPHRLTQLVVSKDLHFEDQDLTEAINSQPQDETSLQYVRMNLEVLRTIFGYTPRKT